MAVAQVRLARVTLAASADRLPTLLAGLIGFERFHPARGPTMGQDIRILLLASRAQELYGRAADLLANEGFRGLAPVPTPPVEFRSTDVGSSLEDFAEQLETVRRNLPLAADPSERRSLLGIVRGIRAASLALFRALQRLLSRPGPGGTIVLEGFIRESDRPDLERRLGTFVTRVETVPVRGPDDPYIPTLLVNPRAVALFERFALERGVPKYNEIDPTPIVALVFPLFFGLMFGDLGHGIALLALGLYLLRRTKWTYWGELILVFGAAAAVVGLVRGVFFGVTFPSPLSGVLAFLPALDARFTLAYIPLLLEAAIVIGTFHLGSAYAIALLNQLRSLRYADALVVGLPTLLLYASLVPLGFAFLGAGFRPQALFTSAANTPFLGPFFGLTVPVAMTALVATPVVLAALAVLVAGPPVRALFARRRGRAIGRAVLDGLLAGVARPAEFFMNTVSYVRLAALLIANTLLGSLVAGALAYGPAGLALAAVLNVLVMAMEGLIVYLQDWRLHMFEWFTRFYSGTGTAFDPLQATGAAFRLHWGPAPTTDRSGTGGLPG